MRSNSLFWGVILVLGGGLLLLSNLGLLGNINVWGMLWPLFLIALGISALWGTFFRRAPQLEHANIPLEGANRARVRLNHGAGRLQIGSGAGAGDLAEGDFGGGLDLDTSHEGDLLDVRMRMPSQVFPIFSWPGWTPGALDWSIRLNPALPLSLDLEAGTNDARIDLSDLKVTDLRLKSGASATDLTLPSNAGTTRARIESGVASVTIRLPAGVAARIRTRGGLSSIHVDGSRFPRNGDMYQSEDYDTAVNKAELEVEMGVGSVTIQ